MKIKKLILEDFRNIERKTFSFEKDFVVFCGKNGKGKTNTIEALAMLSHEGSFRKNKLEELGRLESEAHLPWRIRADIVSRNLPYQIKVSYEGASQRTIQIDDKKAAPKDLSDYIRYIVLTPTTDKVFGEGSAAVRRLIDRMVIAFDPLHADRLQNLNKLLKERKVLCEKNIGSTWMKANAKILAENAIAVAVSRLDFIERLNQKIVSHPTDFPKVELIGSGWIEDKLKEKSALEVEEIYAQYLEKNQDQDSIEGAHRCGLDLIHKDKKMRANLCSTGEQKTMVFSMLLGQAKLIEDVFKEAPIFLLDEGMAHLDASYQIKLIESLKTFKTAVFMTDIEANNVSLDVFQRIDV